MKYQQTIFGQLLQILGRDQFQQIVNKFHGDFKTHKLNCWTQLVTMIYSQIRQRHSLRDIENGLIIQESKLYHLGITPVKRSTLSDANAKRNYRIYEETFHYVLDKCQKLAGRRFEYGNVLHSLDSTVINLCYAIFPWAKFYQTKGGLKLHLYYDHATDLPEFICITERKVSDLNIAKTIPYKPDSIVVFDKGYRHYGWFYELTQNKVTFVTRPYSTFTYTVIGQHDADPEGPVLSDQDVWIPYLESHEKRQYFKPIRLITYQDPDSGKIFQFLTNSENLSALMIARIYKARWQIDLFFKWIKQHLKIKTFLGTSKNAVYTQIWIAMILYLLLWFIKQQVRFNNTLHCLSAIIHESIFERRHLLEVLNLKPKEILSFFSDVQLDFGFT